MLLNDKDIFLIEFIDSLREHTVLKDKVFQMREEVEVLYQQLQKKLENNEELKQDFLQICLAIYDYEQELKKTYFEYGKHSDSLGREFFIKSIGGN